MDIEKIEKKYKDCILVVKDKDGSFFVKDGLTVRELYNDAYQLGRDNKNEELAKQYLAVEGLPEKKEYYKGMSVGNMGNITGFNKCHDQFMPVVMRLEEEKDELYESRGQLEMEVADLQKQLKQLRGKCEEAKADIMSVLCFCKGNIERHKIANYIEKYMVKHKNMTNGREL